MTPDPDGRQALRQGAWAAWLALLGGTGTLLCCALPALLVALGAGAALSSLIASVPQLVWVSEHKDAVFILATVLMALGGAAQWRSRHAPCPVEPALRQACLRTRRLSALVYGLSLLLLALGAWFAYILPWWIGE